MSHDNFETGRIKLIFFSENAQDREDFLHGLCVNHGITEKDDDYSWEEIFQEDVSRNSNYEPKYMILGNGIFEVLEYHSLEDHYHTIVKSEGDGEYSFSSNYYNGGASLEETLENEFERQGILLKSREDIE